MINYLFIPFIGSILIISANFLIFYTYGNFTSIFNYLFFWFLIF